jgi:signal transduction histidine kinase
MRIQEDERRRIAADLHDGLGQSLGLAIVSLENIANLLSQGEPAKAAACLARLNPSVRNMLDELRRVAMNLRPAMLDSLGILATLSWHLREIETACPDITIDRSFSVDESEVPITLRTPIFRILQEAGGNAIAHSEADRIEVRLSKVAGVLELAVDDNGNGFDPHAFAETSEPNRGRGLRNMRERAQLSCGIYEMRSAPGKGTLIRVRWPACLSDVGLGCAAVSDLDAEASREPN